MIKTMSKLRLFCVLCSLGFFILGLILFIRVCITGDDPNARLFSYLGNGIIFGALILLAIIAKKKLNDTVLLILLIYLFFACVCGNMFYFYRLFPGYDKIMHSIFGYIGCIIGFYIVCGLSDYEKSRPLFVGIVCFAVSMACGAMWEIFEFSADVFLGQTSQGFPLIINGDNVVDVTDTMLDLVCNFGGACLFLLQFFLHKKSGKNLLIKSMADNLTRGNEK